MDKPLILKYLMDYIDNLVPPRHREHLCVDPIAHLQSPDWEASLVPVGVVSSSP